MKYLGFGGGGGGGFAAVDDMININDMSQDLMNNDSDQPWELEKYTFEGICILSMINFIICSIYCCKVNEFKKRYKIVKYETDKDHSDIEYQ